MGKARWLNDCPLEFFRYVRKHGMRNRVAFKALKAQVCFLRKTVMVGWLIHQ
jgi:hypothetical protein